METKELKITPPEGYEIDRENSSLDHIKFKPINKQLTYDNIAEKLFKESSTWYSTAYGKISYSENGVSGGYLDPNNCTSEKQAQKLLALNQLMNVAKYLNGDWKPDWNDTSEQKYYLFMEGGKEISVGSVWTLVSADPYFKSKKLAQQALEILGEDTIKLALSTDW